MTCRLAAAVAAAAAMVLCGCAAPMRAQTRGSVRFLANAPNEYDFGDQAALPPSFGRGEFTFELWIRPDTSFPVGPTVRGTPDQLTNWSVEDNQPYSNGGWWFTGNWLLDGHSRPDGFTPANTREGTFSLQFYGGRLRWMFADDADSPPVGRVWTVQAYPASTTSRCWTESGTTSHACDAGWVSPRRSSNSGSMVRSSRRPRSRSASTCASTGTHCRTRATRRISAAGRGPAKS